MDSNPLISLLDDIIHWFPDSQFPRGIQISWSEHQLQTLIIYFSQVEVNSDISCLQLHERLNGNHTWQNRFNNWNDCTLDVMAQLVVTFVQHLGELFKVPKKLMQRSPTKTTVDKNQLVAGFLIFLLQLLNGNPRLFSLHALPDVKNRVVKELRYLVTILADEPFRGTGHDEKVESILTEFELLAKEAGGVVHSLVFTHGVSATTVDEGIGVLCQRVHLLRCRVTAFLEPRCTNGTAVGLDSLYIVDSLVCDLDDLMELDESPFVEVSLQRDQILTLHQQLKLCQSLFEAPQCIDTNELKKEAMVQVIAAAHDAQYLITSFSVGDLPLWYLTIRLTHLIDKIRSNVSRLKNMHHGYNDKTVQLVTDTFSAKLPLPLEFNGDSTVDVTKVGFEQREEIMFDQLIGWTKKLQMIFIHGMGGIGKTTLANKMYCHPLVNCHFDRILRCTVSQAHERKGLLSDILKSGLHDTTKNDLNEGDLELNIYQILKDRRYLIVIDDVWDSKVWDDLQFLPDDGNGSRLLITGRNKSVAPSGSITCELPLLSDDECWELLKKKVFQNECCPPQLHEIGKKIAANCHGLPLAVVVIAGILSKEDREKSSWEHVGLNLDSYMVSDKSNSIMQILELSYKHLPYYLKPCFLYLGVFRKGKYIHFKELAQHWIALGLISKGENGSTECLANEYLSKLVGRSLVIVVERRPDGGAKACVVHDLLMELCSRIAQRENLMKFQGDSYIWNQRYLHLYIGRRRLYRRASEDRLTPYGTRARAVYCPFLSWDSLLHALGVLPSLSGCKYWGSSFSAFNMKFLKGLEINTEYEFLGMELLVNLRYLVVAKMPKSLHKNTNLEFLTVSDDEVCIDSKILKMKKLKYIFSGAGIVLYDSSDASQQTSNLEYLSSVCIRSLRELEMLKCVPMLCVLKCHFFGAVDSLDMSFLTQLESLRVLLQWSSIQEIKFPSNIRRLTLVSRSFPWKIMPTIGALPHLQILKICEEIWESDSEEEGISEVSDGEHVGTWEVSDGEFEQLRFLKLEECRLVQWNFSSSSQSFPKLQELFLDYCRHLVEIPKEIEGIEALQSINIRGECHKSLVESAKRIQEEQRDFGNDCLRVDTRHARILEDSSD